MLKKIFIMLSTIILLVGMCGTVNAAELKTKLIVTQPIAETKYLENDQGYINKSIIEANEKTGEVVVDLSLSNKTNITEDTEKRHENTEILIMVSENIVNEEEKLKTYVSYIETLSKDVFEKNSKTKIGIIGIKGTINDGKEDENGNMIWGENDEVSVKGTADNAEIILSPSSNPNEIKASLQNMNSSKNKYRINLQAAIRLANNSYSDNVNKILICLYDSVPDIAIGVKSEVTYGGMTGYKTVEEAVIAQHNEIADKTNSEILTLKTNKVEFILLRPDDTSYDETWYDLNTGEVILQFDGSPYVQKIYGTLENPTYGKMYSLSNDTLQKIIIDHIYEDIIKNIRANIEIAIIKEYFSDEILENFDIIFYTENIDTTKLATNKCIEWKISDLAVNETANLRYTLKIKNMQNEEILNKVLSTSEKTEMLYRNYFNLETSITSTSSPKIQLAEIKEELTATVSYSPTTNTTGKVTATIKTNKKVNEVKGWTLSEDGMTLTKEFTKNTTEKVHLVDMDNMTKDVVVKISNIIEEQSKDNTVAPDKFPQAGKNVVSTICCIIAIAIVLIIVYKKYNSYKDVK